MQRTLEVIDIEDQNLCGSQSNIDCITVGGNVRPVALHQVRDQTLPLAQLFLNLVLDLDLSLIPLIILHLYHKY